MNLTSQQIEVASVLIAVLLAVATVLAFAVLVWLDVAALIERN